MRDPPAIADDLMQTPFGLLGLLSELSFVLDVPLVRIAERLQPLRLFGQFEPLGISHMVGRDATLFRRGEPGLEIRLARFGRLRLPFESREIELRLLELGQRFLQQPRSIAVFRSRRHFFRPVSRSSSR